MLLFKRLFSWHLTLKRKNLLFLPILRVGKLIKGTLSTSYISSIFLLTNSIIRLIRKNGPGYACRYMKFSSLLIMKQVSNEKTSLRSCTFNVKISLTRGGLPRILPSYFRNEIRRDNPKIIKTVLTVLGLYRVLPYKGEVDLSTITSPWKGTIPTGLIEFFPLFWRLLKVQPQKMVNLPLFSWNPFPIFSSGPLNSLILTDSLTKDPVTGKVFKEKLWKTGNSFSGFIRALLFLGLDHSRWEDISWFLRKCPSSPKSIIAPVAVLALLEGFLTLLKTLFSPSFLSGWSESLGGKLGFKDEPGKVRVFAMVDCLTQWILDPLHRWIFSLLKFIEVTYGTDATFDQDGGVMRLRLLMRKRLRVYSYDLSSATDRLPIFLQRSLLDSVIPSLGDHWANLLVGREYGVPAHGREWLPRTVKYATGQPMGALSSWGMLALTHHLIVQFCAFQVTGRQAWFKPYLVLGDDVVILHQKVAERYLEVMGLLDVGINLSKSLVSLNGHAEFAKRFVSATQDLSGLSLKEFGSLHRGWACVLSLLKKHSINFGQFLQFLGYGPKSSGQFKWTWGFNWSQKRWFYEGYFLMTQGPGKFFSALEDSYRFRWFDVCFEFFESQKERFEFWKKTHPAILLWGNLNKFPKLLNLEFIKSRYLAGRWFDNLFLPYTQDWIPRGARYDDYSFLGIKLIPPNSKYKIPEGDRKRYDPSRPRHKSVISPKVMDDVLSLLQFIIISLFRNTTLWSCLVWGVNPGFKEKCISWFDKVKSFNSYAVRNCIVLRGFLSYKDPRFSDLRNGFTTYSFFCSGYAAIDKGSPKGEIYVKDLYDRDVLLSYLFVMKPSEELTLAQIRECRDYSKLVDLKANLWYSYIKRYEAKRLWSLIGCRWVAKPVSKIAVPKVLQ